MTEESPSIDREELESANLRWDRENHSVAMEGRMAPAWSEARMVLRGKLSDKKIARYNKMGFYSEEYREFRRKRMAKQPGGRRGNFIKEGERLIYNPV